MSHLRLPRRLVRPPRPVTPEPLRPPGLFGSRQQPQLHGLWRRYLLSGLDGGAGGSGCEWIWSLATGEIGLDEGWEYRMAVLQINQVVKFEVGEAKMWFNSFSSWTFWKLSSCSSLSRAVHSQDSCCPFASHAVVPLRSCSAPSSPCPSVPLHLRGTAS
jgi:hypothetical protein